MLVHLSLCCTLPYSSLKTTTFPSPRSAACKVLSFMILSMTNWKLSSRLCLVYKWRLSVFWVPPQQMILNLSSTVYRDEYN